MSIERSLVIFRYQVKSAVKNVVRFRNHSVISLIGLVMGLASVFIISAWTIQELRYDRFHRQSKQIYMMTTDVSDQAGHINRFPETPAPLADELDEKVPQLEEAFHFLYLYGGREIEAEGNIFKEAGLAATPDFFEVFNFRVLTGSADHLAHPHSILISEALADKLFPGTDPINQQLMYKRDQWMEVKGIFKKCPLNSSLQFDFVIPYATEYGISDEWWQLSDATFMKMTPSADPEAVHALIRKVWRERITDDQFDIGLISVADLRYGADFEFFNAEHGHGDRKKLYMFLGVAGLILILACLNYLNLASSYAIRREKETWIRKVHGAGRGIITGSYILESVLLSGMAWVLAALIALLGLRFFERIIGIVISPAYFIACTGAGFFISIILIGFATGFYPALQAGRQVLVQSDEPGRAGIIFQRNLRQIFTGSQFTLSIALTISGLIIFRQANFMKNYDTGYATQNIVEFQLPVNSNASFHEAMDWLNSRPEIEMYSLAGASPVNLTVLNTTEQWRWEGLAEGAHTSVFNIHVDEAYLDVFQISLINGRFFLSMDSDLDKVLVNERFAALMGVEDPVGRFISRGDETYEIIGVVRDFNFQHLGNDIRPLLLFKDGGKGRHLFIHIPSETGAVAAEMQERLSSLLGSPVSFSFVAENRDMLYRGESQILAAVLFFTLLCIVLSSLGLIGMVSHYTAAYDKEFAIRKVFGASPGTIMLSQQFHILKMFLPGLFIGGALAWFIMRRWLQEYAHRIEMEGWVFISGSVIILLFALLSISVQTWRSSKQSPAVSLKHL
jgi:hypothetical protein